MLCWKSGVELLECVLLENLHENHPSIKTFMESRNCDDLALLLKQKIRQSQHYELMDQVNTFFEGFEKLFNVLRSTLGLSGEEKKAKMIWAVLYLGFQVNAA